METTTTTDQVMVTVEDVSEEVKNIDMTLKKQDDITFSILAPPPPPTTIITPTTPIIVRRRYEFQPPSITSTSSSFLGADLSSSLAIMAPPKLNTVKKSRILVNPGKSMVEWMKIQQELAAKGSSSSTNKLRRIGPDELATHNTLGDVWMAINDRVFDVSDYSNYHPGGVDEIMKGAGQDATTLFNQIHRWVNWESILKGNFLGFYVREPTLSSMVRKSTSSILSTHGFSSLPSTKFSEDDESVFLEIDSHMVGDVRQESWTVGILNRERLLLKVMIQPPKVWTTHLQLLKALTDDHININYKNDFKRILITLKKPQHQERWLKLGSPLTDHNQILDSRATVDEFYPTKLFKKEKLSHNSYLFTAVTSSSAVIGVPLGFHVQIRLTNENVSRPFTPVILSITNDDEDDGNSNQNHSQELHFIIKIYPNGQFTSALENMFTLSNNVDFVEVEMGFPRGHFDPLFFQNNVENLILLAGGTGITPFIRIMHYLYRRRKSIPIQKVVLLFFNETLQDVIWDKEWKALSAKEPSWFYYYPVISKQSNGQPLSLRKSVFTGRISIKLFEDCIQDCISSSTKINGDSKAMICGSLGFNASCKQVLKEQQVLDIDDPGGIFIFNG